MAFVVNWCYAILQSFGRAFLCVRVHVYVCFCVKARAIVCCRDLRELFSCELSKLEWFEHGIVSAKGQNRPWKRNLRSKYCRIKSIDRKSIAANSGWHSRSVKKWETNCNQSTHLTPMNRSMKMNCVCCVWMKRLWWVSSVWVFVCLPNSILTHFFHRSQHPLPVAKREAKIYYACEWQKCTELVDTYAELQSHVKQHLDQIETTDDDIQLYECEWDLCGYETNDLIVFHRHALYHVYMTNLKTLGEQLLLKKEPLPACINDSRRRNMIRDCDDKYTCQWYECRYVFEFIQDYFDHVRGHCIHEIETHKHNNRNQIVQCHWLDCTKTFKKRMKMAEHMRTHTGERIVACSNCGSTFNSYVKYYDHYKRQSVTSEWFGSERRLVNLFI